MTDHVDLVSTWLAGRGYRLVARPLRIGRQEIDLVVTDGPQTVFVVVSVSRRRGVGAIELVDRRTARRLMRALGRYFVEHPDVLSIRIDVVAVRLSDGGAWTLEHYVNAVP